MDYTPRIPSAPLNAYIDDLYAIDSRAPYRHLKVLPMPSLHLMINFGDPFRLHDSDHAAQQEICAESWTTGLWSRPYVVNWPLDAQLVGIHFKPGGAYPFLRLPLSELSNQVVSLDAIWGQFAAEVRERLYAAPTIQARLALLEQLLLARLCETLHGQRIVQFAIREIVQHSGTLSIRALSDQIGINQAHLGTLFKRIVGIPPKELARFYRFAHVLRSVNPIQPVEWTQIAYRSGFYDQSHFNREFAAFTGLSPTEYLRLRRRFHAENPEQAWNLGQIPID